MRYDSAFDRPTEAHPCLVCPVRSEPAAHSGGGDFRGHSTVELLCALLQIAIDDSPSHRWQSYRFRNHMRRQKQEDPCFRFSGYHVCLLRVPPFAYRQSPRRAESHFTIVRRRPIHVRRAGRVNRRPLWSAGTGRGQLLSDDAR